MSDERHDSHRPLSVDIVIPTFGHVELTERCLASLRPRDACVTSVIVVDDASPDGSGARLREREDIVAVVLERNRGFAGACNAGASRSTADAIFFLNNDTLVAPGTVERLAATLAESGAVCVGPKLVHGDGTMQCAGLALTANRSSFTQICDYLDADLPQSETAYEPLALCGAAILVRRDAFLNAGGFDEGYRNGYEDVDFSLRMWSAGGRVRYEPRATVVHLEGASRGKTIDDGTNERRFTERWGGRLASAPRRDEPLPPILDIRWPVTDRFDRTLLATWKPLLRAHAGARVIVNTPLAARCAAPFDQRHVLRVDYARGSLHTGSPARRTPSGVIWCAPENSDGAAALATRDAAAYWVPASHAAMLLENAGVARERIRVTRIGFSPPDAADAVKDRTAVVVVRHSRAEDRANEIVRALQPIPTEIVVVEDLDPEALERVRHASFVVFPDRGDAWGLLGTAALSGGAAVVAVAGSPYLEIVPNEACAIVDEAHVACAAREFARDRARAVTLGSRAASEMARRHPDVYAGRRIRELARAHIHGVPDPRALAMTDTALNELRGPA